MTKNFHNAYGNRGHAYYMEKQYDLAIKDFNKAVEIDPQYAVAYTNRDNAEKILTQSSEYNRQGFTGTWQQTLRSVSGPDSTSPIVASLIDRTDIFPVSGTPGVNLNYGGIILRLTYVPNNLLHDTTTFYDTYGGLTEVPPSSGIYETVDYSVYLIRRK